MRRIKAAAALRSSLESEIDQKPKAGWPDRTWLLLVDFAFANGQVRALRCSGIGGLAAPPGRPSSRRHTAPRSLLDWWSAGHLHVLEDDEVVAVDPDPAGVL